MEIEDEKKFWQQ